MTRAAILDRVRKILTERLKLTSTPSDITEDTDLRMEYGVDSLKIVELLAELDDAFGVGLDSEGISGEVLIHVGKLVDFLEKETGESTDAELRGLIREATQDDLEDIIALQRRAFRSVAVRAGNTDIAPMTQTVDEIREEMPGSKILVYEETGAIIGSVRAYESDGTCEIARLIVDPSQQKRGIGTLLMSEIESRMAHCQRFNIFTGAQFDEVIRLYERLGYAIVRREEAQFVPMVFMSKSTESDA